MYKAVYRSLSVLALATGLLAGCGDSKTASTIDSGVAPADSSIATADSAVQEGTGSYIYATAVNTDLLSPQMIIPAFGASTTGTYTIQNSEADFEAVYNGGGFSLTGGRLEGTFSGNTFTGYWYEMADEGGFGYVQRTCDTERGGTLVYGRFTLTFSADRRSFEGQTNSCEGDPADSYDTWTGTLTARGDD